MPIHDRQPAASSRPVTGSRLHSLAARIAGIGRSDTGVSAVEFALFLPVLLLVLVCVMELAHATENYRKVIQLARTVSDLTAQGDKTDPISQEAMNDILAASSLILKPFDGTKAKIVVSAVGVYVVSLAVRPKVCSSVATSNAVARPVGVAADLTAPTGYSTIGMRYVLTEVSMPYTPMLGSRLVGYLGAANGQFTFTVATPWPARGGAVRNSSYTEVRLPGGASCPLL